MDIGKYGKLIVRFQFRFLDEQSDHIRRHESINRINKSYFVRLYLKFLVQRQVSDK